MGGSDRQSQVNIILDYIPHHMIVLGLAVLDSQIFFVLDYIPPHMGFWGVALTGATLRSFTFGDLLLCGAFGKIGL